MKEMWQSKNENEWQWRNRRNKNSSLYPYLLQGQQALPNLRPILVKRPGDARYTTPLPHQQPQRCRQHASFANINTWLLATYMEPVLFFVRTTKWKNDSTVNNLWSFPLFRMANVPLPPPLSLSLTHTHTHTYTPHPLSIKHFVDFFCWIATCLLRYVTMACQTLHYSTFLYLC